MSRQPDSADNRAVLARAYRALDEMQRKIDVLERARREPLAIVGMACRFPGGATDPERLWSLLHAGSDACVEIPSSRWDVDRYYDPDPDNPGTMYMRRANLLESVDGFDPAFFGVSPREAQHMDPQQRMLLEVSWEALENAALAPARLNATATGVFMGISSNDYAHFQLRGEEYSRLEPHSGTGFAHSIVSGRIAYVLGLQGPALSVDTACSSSLVAFHLACQSLRTGECRVALAGGVNLILAPYGFIVASKGRMLSPDGRCKTFDASADGYGRGEGCGVVVLKRLGDAQADGDRILAVVRGTALNQDGRSGGLTVPSGAAQEAVVRLALADAGLTPDQVTYVEAHGTGTSLGDPIEVQALGASLGRHRSTNQPLLIGSVKANIGHLEAAAGIAGVIKLVLALQHRAIPPQPHVTRLNPYIPWDQLNVVVPTQLTPWTPGGGPRIGGVNSFGFSGTNAHAVLEEAPAVAPTAAAEDRPRHVLAISTRTAEGVRTLAGRMAERLALTDDTQLADVCFTAGTGRSHFAHRLAVPTASIAELRDALAAVAAGTTPPGVVLEHVKGARAPEVAFLFSGQGSQYVGMGQSLFDTQPTFRRALEHCDEILRPLMDRSLLSVLYPDRGSMSPIDETGFTQPALFALEWALAELWRSWGVEPAAVMGHSIGELAAACVAGVFSLEDGLALVAARGRLMQALPGGAMAAVLAPEPRVARHVDPTGPVSIAAINGPEHVVISGPVAEVDRILGALAADGISGRRLVVSHAFHSPAMDPMLDAFTRVAESVAYHAPRLALISNVTGQLARDEVTQPGYWREHVRKAVRFVDGMQALDGIGARVLVEIGPSATLLGMARACVPEETRAWLPSLRKGRDEWTQILDTLATLYGRGVAIDWVGFDRDVPRRRLGLPTYPFARDRYWLERPATTTRRARRAGRPDDADDTSLHPLVGRRLSSPLLSASVFEARVSIADLPFLGDHRFQGAVVLPAAAYVEAIRAASAMLLGDEPVALSKLAFHDPMTLPDEAARVVQIALERGDDGEVEFQLFSRAEGAEPGPWVRHVTGRARRDLDAAAVTHEALAAAQARCQDPLDVAEYYARLEESGFRYGPAFQQIRLARSTSEEAVGLIEPGATEDAGFGLHPASLDACFQLVGAVLLARPDTSSERHLYMPTAVERMRIRRRAAGKLWAHARLRTITRGPAATLVADVLIFDETGATVAEVHGLEFHQVTSGTSVARGDQWVHEVQWEARPLAAEGESVNVPGTRGHWLVLADRGGLGEALARELTALGTTCTLIPAAHTVGTHSDREGIDPYCPESFHRLVAGMPEDCGVVHLWGLDATAERGAAAAAFRAADNPGCASVLHLVQALTARSTVRPRGLWVVTKGAQAIGQSETALGQAALLGLGKSVALEHPTLGCRGVDLDPAAGNPECAAALVRELLAPDGESQVAIRDRSRHVARLVARPAAAPVTGPDGEAETRYWTIPARGDLRDLACVRTARRAPGPGEVEIRVHAAGLNFRDVLNTLGLLSDAAGPIGLECAGEVVRLGDSVQGLAPGDLVMGIASPSFGTYVTTRAELMVAVPPGLGAVEAATTPVAFLTAQYGLVDLAKLSTGESVLIHAAAGGVGLAAVQIAQRAGATVYATAGSPEKRAFLQGLGVPYVFDSRSLRFADEIMVCTEGRGVDVVLNSLNGDFIAASVSVLAPAGRFLEIGKRDIWDMPTMRQNRPDVAYWPYDLSTNLFEDPPLIPRLLRKVAQRLAGGELRPLPSSVFPLDEAHQAFRHMARARHIGKVVLSVAGASHGRTGVPALRPDATYLVSGGRGGIGLHLAEWLVRLGARRVALLGRSEPSTAAREALARMEQAGARVSMEQVDVSEPEAVARVVDQLGRTGLGVRGVFHCAGVLDDGVLAQQSWERFVRVMTPKVDGAWNLHQATRHLSLDYFVLFSSASALFGAAGQSNYAAGNAFLDALAHYRRAQGLPGLSVNWGAWSGGGMATSLGPEHLERWRRQGMGFIDPETGLDVLGRLMDGGPAQVAVLPITWSRFLETDAPVARSPLLTRLRARQPLRAATKGHGHGATAGWAERLRAASGSIRDEVVGEFLLAQLASVLQIPPSSVPADEPLTQLGLDSLMAVELRNRIEKGLGISVPVVRLLQDSSVTTLGAFVLEQVTDGTAAHAVVEDDGVEEGRI